MRIRDREDIVDVLARCEAHWLVNRIPEARVDEMRDELHQHLREAAGDGKPVESVVGGDVLAFAEAWAEEHNAEPDPRPELTKDVVMGWVLSFSACAAVLATFAHLTEWSLYVPAVWVFGTYLFLAAAWFGQPVADLFERAKSWRYSPWKSMLAAGLVVLIVAAVATLAALFFMVVGPRIPFEWPWYATVACALVACSIVAGWLYKFSREEAEREKQRSQGI